MSNNASLRIFRWAYYRAPYVSPAENVAAYEAFAEEFERMPLDDWPGTDWREMAACCRRLAADHRAKGVAGAEILPGRGSVPADGYSEAAATTRPRRVRRQGRGAGVD
jgi:hypothetical protein